jgi:hypothetical protein
MKTQTVKYLRLMDYDNACKVIDFINNNDKDDYANITTGGVSMQVSNENWDIVTEYIKSLGVRYEITLEHPYKVEQQIVQNLKEMNIINN